MCEALFCLDCEGMRSAGVYKSINPEKRPFYPYNPMCRTFKNYITFKPSQNLYFFERVGMCNTEMTK